MGGVHPDLQHGMSAGPCVRVRIGEPVGEVVAALTDHRERLESATDLSSPGGGVQVAGERDDSRRHRRGGNRVECVQQRRGGDLGRNAVADGRREPGLGAAGLGSLGDHQQRYRQNSHEITFQKSRIAMMLPRREPLTLDLPPVRGP